MRRFFAVVILAVASSACPARPDVAEWDGLHLGALDFTVSAVLVDDDGNLLVARGNPLAEDVFQGVEKYSATGERLAFVGGPAGFADGAASEARFSFPTGLAFADDGSLFVSDFFNSRLRRISEEFVVATVAGRADAGFVDGAGSSAAFDGPGDLVRSASAILVADYNNAAVRAVSTDGNVETLVGQDAPFTALTRRDSTGQVFGLIAQIAAPIRIVEVRSDGTLEDVVFAERGCMDGPPGRALLDGAVDLVAVEDGFVLLDETHERLRHIDDAGNVTTLLGGSNSEGDCASVEPAKGPSLREPVVATSIGDRELLVIDRCVSPDDAACDPPRVLRVRY